MTTPDLHPEELFDKAARGELDDAERAMLDAHLAHCAVCRFEQQVAADFAAMPMPALNVDQLVTNALTAKASASMTPPPRMSRRVGYLLAAAISMFAFGSFAAVAQWTGLLPKVIAALSEPKDEAPPPPPPAAPVSKRHAVEPPAPAAEPPPDVVPEPEPVVVSPAPTPRVVRQPAPPPPPPPTAAELFAQGNRARLDGERALAIATYQQLLTTFPDSVESTQTRATLGRLLLDQGNPSAAIEQLDAYLAGPDGTLKEDVMSARAQAFMRLGREQDEADAWQALLSQYPDSIHAPRARARLGALDAGQ